MAVQGAPALRAVLAEDLNIAQKVLMKPGMLLIGPEGDFTADELAALMAAGALAVGLGPNRLRVETAAIAVLTGALLLTDKQELNNSPKGNSAL